MHPRERDAHVVERLRHLEVDAAREAAEDDALIWAKETSRVKLELPAVVVEDARHGKGTQKRLKEGARSTVEEVEADAGGKQDEGSMERTERSTTQS